MVSRRQSASAHARRSRVCDLCGKEVFGNGGWVSHNRAHVRRGELVEFEHVSLWQVTRRFVRPDEVETFLSRWPHGEWWQVQP